MAYDPEDSDNDTWTGLMMFGCVVIGVLMCVTCFITLLAILSNLYK